MEVVMFFDSVSSIGIDYWRCLCAVFAGTTRNSCFMLEYRSALV
jgi:hypothetical protein